MLCTGSFLYDIKRKVFWGHRNVGYILKFLMLMFLYINGLEKQVYGFWGYPVRFPDPPYGSRKNIVDTLPNHHRCHQL